MSVTKPKWNTGHFPTGTVCETELFNTRAFIVNGISCNGPGSYILHTDLPCDIEGIKFQSLNICHVSKIIKRGEGEVDIKTQNKHSMDFIKEQKFINILKHKSQYLSYFGTMQVVRFVASKYETPDMIVDYEKLSESLYKQGVFSRKITEYSHVFVCNKKRLNKTIKRIINKHLILVKAAIRKEEEFYDEYYYEDLVTSFEFDDLDLTEQRQTKESCYSQEDNYSPFDNRDD